MFRKPENLSVLAHRPALGNAPPAGWARRLRHTLLKVAPQGLTHVQVRAAGAHTRVYGHAMRAPKSEQLPVINRHVNTSSTGGRCVAEP